MSIVRDQFNRPGESASLGLHFPHAAAMTSAKGEVFIEMVDAATGEILHKDHRQNVITLDAGILAAILFTASGADSASQGALLLLSYALGMTLPFVLAAVFNGPFLAWAARFRRHMQWIERVMGGLLIVFSVMIATDSMSIVAGWLLQIAPDIGTLQ